MIWKHLDYVFLFQDNNFKNLKQRLKKDQRHHTIPTDLLLGNSSYIDCLYIVVQLEVQRHNSIPGHWKLLGFWGLVCLFVCFLNVAYICNKLFSSWDNPYMGRKTTDLNVHIEEKIRLLHSHFNLQ